MQACTGVCRGVQGHTHVPGLPGHLPCKGPPMGHARGCQSQSKVQLEAEHPWEAGRLSVRCCTAPVVGRDVAGACMEWGGGQHLPRKGMLA